MANNRNNRVSGASFQSDADEELVIIRLGGPAGVPGAGCSYDPQRSVISSQPTLTSTISSYNSADYVTQQQPKVGVLRASHKISN
jgi:hypothetical protein